MTSDLWYFMYFEEKNDHIVNSLPGILVERQWHSVTGYLCSGWALQSYISSPLHYKNPTSDSWKLPGLTQGPVEAGIRPRAVPPFSTGDFWTFCSIPLHVIWAALETVVLERFCSRNKKLNMGVFKTWCGWCSITEGQVTKLWLNGGCLWNWPWPSGYVSSQCPCIRAPYQLKGERALGLLLDGVEPADYPVHVPSSSSLETSEEIAKIFVHLWWIQALQGCSAHR